MANIRWRSFPSLVFFLVVLASPSGGEEGNEAPTFRVSMVSLLASPASHAGDWVDVFGFLRSDWALYLTKDHADSRDVDSSITVSDVDTGTIAKSGCMDRYVRIQAKLRVRAHAPTTLSDVRSVFVAPTEDAPNGYYCYRAD